MKTARDIMTKNPLCINLRDRLYHVAEIFLHRNFKSLPVIDHNKKCIGILTEFEITRAFIDTFYKFDKTEVTIEKYQKLLQEPQILYENDEITKVLKVISRPPTHRVIVLQRGSDALAGIISPQDLLGFLYGERSQTASMQEEFTVMQRELAKMKAQMQELESELHLFESFYSNSPYMVHSVDKKYRVIFANENLHKALGYSNGELIGRQVYDLYPESRHDQVKKGLIDVISHGKQALIYTSLRKKDGMMVPIDLSSSAIRDSNGRFICTMTVSRPLKEELMHKALEDFTNKED